MCVYVNRQSAPDRRDLPKTFDASVLEEAPRTSIPEAEIPPERALCAMMEFSVWKEG